MTALAYLHVDEDQTPVLIGFGSASQTLAAETRTLKKLIKYTKT